MWINKGAILLTLIAIPAVIFAQFNHNTTSPYSRYGLGDLQPGNFGRSAAMGGAKIGSRSSYYINLSNPASYSSADTLSFLFEFGFKSKFSSFKTDISKMTTNDINFDYLAFIFPVSKRIGFSFGLLPFSDSGYDIQLFQDEENFGKVWHRYNGDGSLSKVYTGIGIRPFKFLSVGADFYYLFGTLTRNANVVFLEGSDFYTNQMFEQIRLRDFGMKLGLQTIIPFNDKKSVTVGATYENKPSLTSFHSLLAQKYLSFGTSSSDIDTIKNVKEEKGSITMPSSFGIGISYRNIDKLEINADYVYQAWSDARFFGEANPFLTDANKYSVGVEYIPDKYSIRSYFDRMAFRSGFRYEETYLNINGHHLADIGISFGIGLPVFRSYSMVNVSAEVGKMGTKEDNLVKENYFKMTLSVNLYDQWFIKRKFD
jgi:hypothetical protein